MWSTWPRALQGEAKQQLRVVGDREREGEPGRDGKTTRDAWLEDVKVEERLITESSVPYESARNCQRRSSEERKEDGDLLFYKVHKYALRDWVWAWAYIISHVTGYT